MIFLVMGQKACMWLEPTLLTINHVLVTVAAYPLSILLVARNYHSGQHKLISFAACPQSSLLFSPWIRIGSNS